MKQGFAGAQIGRAVCFYVPPRFAPYVVNIYGLLWDTLSQSGKEAILAKKRNRSLHLHVMVSEEEQTQIQERMAEVGICNMGAYMRKMALNGYVLQVDLAPVRELVSLQRRCSNNLNQVAIGVNTYGGIYPDEIKALQKDYADLWEPLANLLEKLSTLTLM